MSHKKFSVAHCQVKDSSFLDVLEGLNPVLENVLASSLAIDMK